MSRRQRAAEVLGGDATKVAISTFRYWCPDCDGAGELFVDTNPRDPAAGRYTKCWTCDGDGTVTLHWLDEIDAENATRSDDYTPPERTLRVVTDDDWTDPNGSAA